MYMLKTSQTDQPMAGFTSAGEGCTLLLWLEVLGCSFTLEISKCSTFVQKHLISPGSHSCSNWGGRSAPFCSRKQDEQSWDRAGHSPHMLIGNSLCPNWLTMSCPTSQWHPAHPGMGNSLFPRTRGHCHSHMAEVVRPFHGCNKSGGVRVLASVVPNWLVLAHTHTVQESQLIHTEWR